MDEHTITPAQEVRLRMIQPMMDCDDCISDKTLRYKMAAEAAQQHQTTTRRILRLYYRYLATGRLTQKRTQQASKSNQMIERAIRRYYFGAKRLSLSPRLMAVDPQELHIQTLPRDTAKLTRKGLRINRMWYAPDDADGLTIGDSYTVAYDPADLRRIHIILADWICPCHAIGIGQPLSEIEWEKAHKAAKKNRGAARAKETASSIAATQAIRAIIEHADSHRETIQRVDGEQIKQDKLTERGQLT